MGQKAKNAGKKVSKTCDRIADGKSDHAKGTKIKRKTLRHMEDFEKLLDEHSGHTREQVQQSGFLIVNMNEAGSRCIK